MSPVYLKTCGDRIKAVIPAEAGMTYKEPENGGTLTILFIFFGEIVIISNISSVTF